MKMLFNRTTSVVVLSLLVAAIPVLVIGPDIWAETQVEYLDIVKSFKQISLNGGWFGYWAALPQFASALYHQLFAEIIQPHWYARLVVSIIIAMVAYLCLIQSRMWIGTFIVIELVALSMHPSISTLTSVGYFLFLPLLLRLLIELMAYDKTTKQEKIMWGGGDYSTFILGSLSKATFLFLPILFWIRRHFFFVIIAFVIGLLQLGATLLAQPSNGRGGANSFIQTLLALPLALGALVDRIFAGSIIASWTNYSPLIMGGLGTFISVGLFLTYYLQDPKEREVSYTTFLKNRVFILLLLYACLLPFVQGVNPSGESSLREIASPVFNLVYKNFKLQYFIVASIILGAYLLLEVQLFRLRSLRLALRMILFAGLLVSATNFVVTSRSSDINAHLSLFTEMDDLSVWRCFAITPFPGWGAYSGGQVDRSLFVLGGCKHFTLFEKFGEVGFSSIIESNINNTQNRTWSYLFILDTLGYDAKSLANFAGVDRVLNCTKSLPPVHVSKYRKEDRFIYASGVVLDPSLQPFVVKKILENCIGVITNNHEMSNLVVMLPDPK